MGHDTLPEDHPRAVAAGQQIRSHGAQVLGPVVAGRRLLARLPALPLQGHRRLLARFAPVKNPASTQPAGSRRLVEEGVAVPACEGQRAAPLLVQQPALRGDEDHRAASPGAELTDLQRVTPASRQCSLTQIASKSLMTSSRSSSSTQSRSGRDSKAMGRISEPLCSWKETGREDAQGLPELRLHPRLVVHDLGGLGAQQPGARFVQEVSFLAQLHEGRLWRGAPRPPP